MSPRVDHSDSGLQHPTEVTILDEEDMMMVMMMMMMIVTIAKTKQSAREMVVVAQKIVSLRSRRCWRRSRTSRQGYESNFLLSLKPCNFGVFRS